MEIRIFGEVKGFEEGAIFQTRKEVSNAKLHRPTQAGISGSELEGADSIVLSGGYSDDIDNGDEIIYTGHGGQDQNKKVQIANQEFTKQNKALVISCNENLPVRVIRGYQLKSNFSPKQGYRYDGLYYVTEYWTEKGKDGFDICRFRLKKDYPLILPTTKEDDKKNETQRREQKINRIVRNSRLAQDLKRIYDYKCQVCGVKLKVLGGYYIEAAHIKGLGEPHCGPDIIENMICLCPNHHTLFDKGMFSVNSDYSINGLIEYNKLCVNTKKHNIKAEYFEYHKNAHVFNNNYKI